MGSLAYHDFGRYITPEPNGRVRGATTDRELELPMKAQIDGDKILNLDEILHYLANNPKKTHGDGKLVAALCHHVDYQVARNFIDSLMAKGSYRYAALIKDACNCARFVTETLMASITDPLLQQKLLKATRFTPSTVGNVVGAATDTVYEAEGNDIREFTTTVWEEIKRCFWDRIPGHQYHVVGTLQPKPVGGLSNNAQWLSGIASGTWFELSIYQSDYRIRRVSPYGAVDVDGIFKLQQSGFDIEQQYQFVYDSNCLYCHVQQEGVVYRFEFLRDL